MTPYANRFTQSECAETTSFSVSDLALVLLGLGLHLAAYESLLPVAAAVMLFGCGIGGLWLVFGARSWELRAFTRIFAVGWVAAGVAGMFAEHFGDLVQLDSDASTFFEMASDERAASTIDEVRPDVEAAAAVVAWGYVYETFSVLGFPRARYLGVLLNVFAVAISATLAVRTARAIYGNDGARSGRIVLMMSCCGLFWLYAALHLRESMVLLCTTSLVYLWVWFLARPDLRLRLAILVAGSLAMTTAFAYLRSEFLFMPLAFAAAGAAAIAAARGLPHLATLFAGGIALSSVGMILVADLGWMFQRATESYGMHYMAEAASDSLGMALIVNQAPPVRAAVGTVYLFVYPVPMWLGFSTASVYHWFKSCNVVLMHCILPLLAMAIRILWIDKTQRRASVVFLLFVVVGMSIGVAVTSLETRHWGHFLVPVFLLALLPDLREPVNWFRYKRLLLLMLVAVGAVHAAWIALKL